MFRDLIFSFVSVTHSLGTKLIKRKKGISWIAFLEGCGEGFFGYKEPLPAKYSWRFRGRGAPCLIGI